MKRNLILTITVFLLVFVVTQIYMVFDNKNLNVIENTSESENTYIAFYSEDDTPLPTMPSKDDGYVLDEENSYCEVNGVRSNEVTVTLTNDWKVQIHGLSNSRTRCNLHFKKSPDPFINPKETVDAATGNGLYKVEHGDLTSEEGGIPVEELDDWKKTEWRYAGPNPNNYVWFNCKAGENSGDTNCEKWRIIGLVNVKTTNGIEQRLKIIRADSIENNAWDSGNVNDWSKASLQTYLNGTYYSSINATAQGMIATDIIWNLGGSSTYDDVTVSMFYERERGTTVYSNRPKEWNLGKQSIALSYPSDYGYATSGGSTGRTACFAKELYNWDNGTYQTQCAGNDWLKPASGWMWTLSPDSSSSSYVFIVDSGGYVGSDDSVNNSGGVWPALYLSSKVSISGGEGSSTVPFELSVQ